MPKMAKTKKLVTIKKRPKISEVINQYTSIRQAHLETGLSRNTITSMIEGKPVDWEVAVKLSNAIDGKHKPEEFCKESRKPQD